LSLIERCQKKNSAGEKIECKISVSILNVKKRLREKRKEKRGEGMNILDRKHFSFIPTESCIMTDW
jgi:hypothetical protein